MKANKLIGVLFATLLLIGGAWLLWRPTTLTPESSASQTLRQEANAPGRPTDFQGEHPDELIDLGNGKYAYPPVRPATVNASEVESKPVTLSMYERWQLGLLDLEENEGLTKAEREALIAAAMRMGPDSNILQPSGPNAPLPAGVAFDSMDYTESSQGYVPPDPELSVGPDHLVAVINSNFEVYDKQGNSVLGPVNLDTFFAPAGGGCDDNFNFDGNTIFDEEAGRYLIGADGNGTHYCLGVSQTDDPTGNWNLYAFRTDIGGAFFDYPHAGVGRDAIYMGANMFPSSFSESRIWAFDKEAMYAGVPAAGITRSLGANNETPQPMNLHGWEQGTWPTDGPHYIFTGVAFNNPREYRLHSWEDPFGADVFTTLATFNLQNVHGVTVGFPVGNVQQGGSTITANDPRPQDFEYRNGTAWSAMTVSCNPGSGTVNCIQWVQVDLANAAVVQAGVYGSNATYRYFPDTAPNNCNDVAIGYSRSSSTSYPSVWVTGRENFDPPNTLQSDIELKAGEVPYTAFADRWGDYTGMTIDPDGQTFWYLGEYSKNLPAANARWATYIGSYVYESCLVPDFALSVEPESLEVCIPDDGEFLVDVRAFQGYNDPVTLDLASPPAGIVGTFDPNPVVPPGTSTLTVETAAASEGSYSLDIVGIAPTSTHTVTVGLSLFAGAPEAPTLVSPANGANGQGTSPTFEWLPGEGSQSYTFELATDPSFNNIIESASGLTEPFYELSIGLDPLTTYYWRVRSENICGDGANSQVFNFTTGNIVCEVIDSTDVPLPIGPNGGTTTTSEITVQGSGSVEDVNVLNLAGTHTWIADLTFYLEGPDGTEVQLQGQICGSEDNFDINYDDEAAPGTPPCPPTDGGTYQPIQPLSAFDGDEANGSWTLRIQDNANGDGGQLQSWSLELCYTGNEGGTGMLVGTVTASTRGGPIEGATITANAGDDTFTTTTDANGDYSLELPAGLYQVTAEAPGFTQATIPDVTIVAGEVTEQDFALQPEGATAITLDALTSTTGGLNGLALAMGALLLATGALWVGRRARR